MVVHASITRGSRSKEPLIIPPLRQYIQTYTPIDWRYTVGSPL